ncbi:hypothetical protein K7X08_020118 [Anisodus acutangulus]|uniref:C3H1-type domain-containing protein n=1 Tax=Anisodus acutangulus TaxID=402998 RepID=A0A9Q1RE06_9SOLA|nr:hypothetical protein K7X08_020118 [Anisodus acutangulus]
MDGSKRVFNRLGPSQQQHGDNNNKQPKVCYHWRAGRCNRFPCPFFHRELSAPPHQQQPHGNNGMSSSSSEQPHGFSDDNNRGGSGLRRNPNFNNTWGRTAGGGGAVVRKTEKVCNYWVKGNCTYGNTCRYLHSWTTGDCFTLLTQLEGDQKVVTGIAFPSGSDKLYSGSTDKTVRVWDCQSGQCAGVVNFDGEVGCMLSEGPWIFVGITNLVKAWNTQTGTDLSLNGPVGQVYALVVGNDMLLAGTEDGILAWKYNGSTNNFDPITALTGHTHHVVSLVVGANRLYSGSMDNSIRVWNLETLLCLQILTDHTSVVMSVLCWDQFLLSCSLDKTIKVWAANESGNLEVTYTHQEERGLLALCGMHDAEAKPVLLCSCNDNTIRVYDLPSFSERGKIFSKEGVRRIEIGPAGLFFTGDESGQVRVWKWSTESSSSTS